MPPANDANHRSNLVTTLVVAALLLPWAWILSRLRGGDNHVGFDPRYLAVTAAPALAWAALGRRRPRLRGVLLGLAVLSIAGLLWLHATARLLDYETWLKRGMPSPDAGR